jgi:hypothetical protein
MGRKRPSWSLLEGVAVVVTDIIVALLAGEREIRL